MVWKDCGYVSLTKKHDRLRIVVKHQRYDVDLKELMDVLGFRKGYALIHEPPVEEQKDVKEKA